MPATFLQPDALAQLLVSCGYLPDLLRSDFRFGNNSSVPLVGFAQSPMDVRSACVAVLSCRRDLRAAVESCRPLGAPIVFVCFEDTLQWWKQGTRSAEWIESVPSDHIESFFQNHRDEFSPGAVYRAKTLGRINHGFQLSFVDLGLMPFVEEESGKAISRLIERNVFDIKEQLGWSDVTDEQGHWLLKSVFWLVSARILRDKQVPDFEDLQLSDVEEVFSRLAGHYGTGSFSTGSKATRAALRHAARTIDQFSSLAPATTESLAYVYENTLIAKETRTSLGTHSTPSYLVDYIVGNLADWIREIPENERSVFEPACGHAAFLVSAMRLLTQLLSPQAATPARRRQYLRGRLRGTDRDPFALELARLALTLSDIPNPDGWDLRVEDMFLGNRLADQTHGKTILLANPPFAAFSKEEIAGYIDTAAPIVINNKAAELLRRTLPELPAGSVFGAVLPQSVLHGSFAEDLRRYLVEHFELREVSLFPDKVFSFSDAESAVVLGRRLTSASSARAVVRFRRIRDWQVAAFRETYEAQSTQSIDQSRFNEAVGWDMRIPDLEEVWVALAANPTLAERAEVGTGLIYHGKDLPSGARTYANEQFAGGHRGFVKMKRGLRIHELPQLYWMNLAKEAILWQRAGTTVGIPQVLMSYARVSRGPWRVKAFIDRDGRPAASAFLTVRPHALSLESLWAILNSPVANAYAFCHLGKRHNIAGDMRRIPLPATTDFEEIESAVRSYLDAAVTGSEPSELGKLMLLVDAAVLEKYALPNQLERALLSLFTGWQRAGVQFKQDRYFPPDLPQSINFADSMAYEADWPSANRRRGELVDKEIAGTISGEEAAELARLQAYADYYLHRTSPRPAHILRELEERVFKPAATEEKEA